jgi:ketosteroid isomerase-like protein
LHPVVAVLTVPSRGRKETLIPSDRGPALEQRVHQLFVLIDSLDFERLDEYVADDVRVVDELSGGWCRGRNAFEEYYDQLKETVASIESRLSGFETCAWGDAGLVTFELAQRYRLGEEQHRIRAPTSVVFRRGPDGWKIVLIHSVPLAEQGRVTL